MACCALIKLSRSVSRWMTSSGCPVFLGQDLIQALFDVQDMLGVDVDIRRLALGAAAGLMDHDVAVGQCKALALGARRQQEGAHAGRHPHANGGDIAANVLHRIVNRQPEVTEPPGLLIYTLISFSGSCPSKYNSWATTTLAMASFTSPVSIMIRSLSRREKIS